MDYLEKQYGIKENNRQYIISYSEDLYNNSYDSIRTVKGEIVNMNCDKVFMVNDNGLFIIGIKLIKLMKPIIKNKLK